MYIYAYVRVCVCICMCMCMCMYIHLYVPICLPHKMHSYIHTIYLSISWFLPLYFFLSLLFPQSFYPSLSLSLYLSIHLSIHLSLSTYLSIYLSSFLFFSLYHLYVGKRGETGIVYCLTQKDTVNVAIKLSHKNISCDFYHAGMCMYVNTYLYTYMHTCIHTYIHACTHTYIHTYIHAYMYTYHTYTHTHTTHTLFFLVGPEFPVLDSRTSCRIKSGCWRAPCWTEVTLRTIVRTWFSILCSRDMNFCFPLSVYCLHLIYHHETSLLTAHTLQ